MSAQSAPSSDRRPSRPGPSYFAPDLAVTGRIATSGDLEIDGQVDGTVDAQRLKVGPHGRVRATLGAEDAIVSGKVVGVLKARGVTFTDGCHFSGEVQYEQVGMEPAADVEGRLHPVIDGNARTDIGQTVRTAPKAQAPKAAARPVPHIPRHTAAVEPVPPSGHPVLKGLAVAAVLIAAAVVGALYISPAARDWRAALVDSVRQGSAVGGPVAQPSAAAPHPEPKVPATAAPAEATGQEQVRPADGAGDTGASGAGSNDTRQTAPTKAVVPAAPPKPEPPPLPPQATPEPVAPVAPVKTPPAATSPAPEAPAKAEPVTAKPGTAQPVKTEPVKVEPVKAEPVKAEPVKAKPAIVEPATVEPTAPAPLPVEPAKQTVPKSPPKSEPAPAQVPPSSAPPSPVPPSLAPPSLAPKAEAEAAPAPAPAKATPPKTAPAEAKPDTAPEPEPELHPRPAPKPDAPPPASRAPASQAPASQPPAVPRAAPTPAAPAPATLRGGAKAEDDGCQWVKQCAPDDPERCVSVRRCDR